MGMLIGMHWACCKKQKIWLTQWCKSLGHLDIYCLLNKRPKGRWSQANMAAQQLYQDPSLFQFPNMLSLGLWLLDQIGANQLTWPFLVSKEAEQANLCLYSWKNERSQRRLFDSQPTVSATVGKNICIIYNS